MKLAKAPNRLLRAIQNTIDYSFYGHLFQRCADGRHVRQGKQLHASLVLSSAVLDNFLASKLITLYSKTQHLREAQHVFDQIPQKNTFSWNALLIGYSMNDFYIETLQLFSQFMHANPCSKADNFTMTCVLKALSGVSTDSIFGKLIHSYVVKDGFDSDIYVGNGLITYYSRCDDMGSARRMFDQMPERDLVSWNSIISGYSQSGFYQECKNLYMKMLDLGGELRPNKVTVLSILQACAYSTDLVLGLKVHNYVIQNQITMDLSLCNSIVGLYAKCGSLDFARELFQEMTEKDDITYGALISGYMIHGFVNQAIILFREMRNPVLSVWNAVISGLVQNNQLEGVFHLVQEMQMYGLKPNSITVSSILPAVPSVSNLKVAKEIHAFTIRNKYDRDVYVITAIIDAYGKLGFVHGVEIVFHNTKVRNVMIWTAIISAYAANGDSKGALCLFNEMVKYGIQPDSVTFTAVLTACAHAGLVSEAWEIFQSLVPKYGIEPMVEHYACMVGVLSRAGKLSEAVKFVCEMPIEPTAKVLGALFYGASVSGDLELGKLICDHLFKMEPANTGNYMVMAELYSKVGRWEEAEEIRGKMDEVGLKKVAGSSWIETCGGS